MLIPPTNTKTTAPHLISNIPIVIYYEVEGVFDTWGLEDSHLYKCVCVCIYTMLYMYIWVVVKIMTPFLGTLNIRCRIIIGNQKGTIINFDNHP